MESWRIISITLALIAMALGSTSVFIGLFGLRLLKAEDKKERNRLFQNRNYQSCGSDTDRKDANSDGNE